MTSSSMTNSSEQASDQIARKMLIVSHTSRQEAIDAAIQVMDRLLDAGVTPVLEASTRSKLERHTDLVTDTRIVNLDETAPLDDFEICIVLGGDGTILRAAEIVRDARVPIIGVNLGHVGFLAESERESIPTLLERVLDRSYEVEERLAISVTVERPGEAPESTWALNEASLEKAHRQRMVEVIIAVDGQPLESFGCDGVILATPTGSTAYSFSAGGPIVWPGVEALLAVPICAHALFARPIVVGTDSTLVVDLLERTNSSAVLSCDGRRSMDITPGTRVTVRKSDTPVLLARLHEGPFTKRLVDKFQLPIAGWRGGAEQP